MESGRTARRREFLINAAYVLFVVGAVLLIARWLLRFLLPLVLAMPLAAALQRPRRWLEKRLCGGSRAAAGVLVTLILALTAAAAVLILWRAAVWLGQDPATTLLTQTGDMWERMQATMVGWERQVAERLSPELGEALTRLRTQLAQQLPQLLSAWLTDTLGSVASTAFSRLPEWLVGALVFVMAAVGLTVEYERVWDFILRQLPDSRRKTVVAARGLCSQAAKRLLKAYGLLLLITFGELLLGLWLLRVQGALQLAAVIALVDILPIIGAGVALIPWAAVCLLTGETTTGVGLLVLWSVISLVRRVLEPRVVGREMGLHPLVTLAVMLLGLKIAGFGGLLLFPVAAMLILELHRHKYLQIWK